MATPNEFCAPVEALGIDGAQPQEGDQVTVEMQGTLDRVVDGLAYVTAQRVNGQPVPESKPSEEGARDQRPARRPEPGGELPSEQELLAEAREFDRQGY
jgi:hypothetical protein